MRKVLLWLLIVATAVFLGVNYFHVSGAELEGGKTLDEHCRVTITWQERPQDAWQQVELTNGDAASFGRLLCGSHFVRLPVPKEIVPGEGQACYHIRVDFPGSGSSLEMESIGGSYIRFLNQYQSRYLKIWSGNWEAGLEQLLGRGTS